MYQFFQACSNSVPQTAWLKKPEVYFLIVLQPGGLSLRCRLSWFLLSPLSVAYNVLFCSVFTWSFLCTESEPAFPHLPTSAEDIGSRFHPWSGN